MEPQKTSDRSNSKAPFQWKRTFKRLNSARKFYAIEGMDFIITTSYPTAPGSCRIKMLTINYWGPRITPFRIGHLSLELEDGTYISHWPGDKSKQISPSKQGKSHHTFEDDVKAEGGEPNEIVKIPAHMINIAKIKEWWNSMIEKGTKYNLWAENCAQIVIRALWMGGLWSRILSSEIFFITPRQALQLIKAKIESGIGLQMRVIPYFFFIFNFIILIILMFLLFLIGKKVFLYCKRTFFDSNVCTTKTT